MSSALPISCVLPFRVTDKKALPGASTQGFMKKTRVTALSGTKKGPIMFKRNAWHDWSFFSGFLQLPGSSA